MLKTGFPWHTSFHNAVTINEEELLKRGFPLPHETALSKQTGGSHYKDKKVQPVEYAHANNLGFMEANVVKYITRHKDKNKAQDIRKAIDFCHFILELEYGEKY